MKKALILHGREGTSESHWLPWMREELEGKGYEVVVPDLPNTDYPVIEDQGEFLFDFTELKDGLKEGDVVIGHSLGCQLGLKYIEEKQLRGVKVIFVAPSYNELADELGEARLEDAFFTMSNAFNTQYNFRQLNKLGNSYVVMLSDDDPYINSFAAKEFYGQLDSVEFVDFHGKGHFNTSAGVKSFQKRGNTYKLFTKIIQNCCEKELFN